MISRSIFYNSVSSPDNASHKAAQADIKKLKLQPHSS